MSIINEVFSSLDINNISDNYRYYNLGGKAVYVENFKKITTFSSSEIVLKLKLGFIKIFGDNLFIKELNNGSMLVEGTIKGVEVY
jgi:sporulation protein YqfC